MRKTKIPTTLRYTILQRDSNRCLWCGRTAADGIKLHVDHVVPESFGGETSYENLGTLCNQCNIGKSNEYCGDYLLTTLLKVKNFESRIEHKKTESPIGPDGGIYDGRFNEFRIEFFQKINENGPYEKKSIVQRYLIPGILLACSTEDVQIKKDERKKKAFMEFKDKIKNYLFENQGFLEELDGRLIFVKKKREK